MSTSPSSARWGVLGLVTLALLVALWLVRPWFHGLVLFFYTNPAVVEALVLAVVGLALASWILSTDAETVARAGGAIGANDAEAAGRYLQEASSRRLALASVVVAATLVLVVLVPVLGNAYAQVHVAETLAVESTDSLPGIDADQPRMLPASVARQYAENSLQYPRYRLTEGDIAIRNGTPHWSFGLAPDGAVNSLVLVGRGGSFVDMTTQQKRVDVVESDPSVGFGYGLGQGSTLVSEYRWRLQKEHYLATYEGPVVLEHEDDVQLAVPKVTYDFHVRWTPIPVVYATPEWGGTALVAPDGETDHLSSADAREHPVLDGQRLFPFDLSRYYVQSMRYKNGILNKWFVHEDELELAPLPGDDNDQPFLVVTERQGLQYFVAAEPYGEAQGIYQLWMFDARTGAASRFQLPVDAALMGPRRAADFVRKANSRTDWDRFAPSEPVPAVVNDTLYWQVRVVPSDSSGIAYTAFVDADTGDVFTFETDERIRAFLAGETDVRPGDTRPGSEDVSVVILIRDADGNVVNRVDVTRGQTIEIQSPGNATAEPTTAAG